MPDLPLLVNIAVALAYALTGGLLARALRLPTIVGYMLAGVALSPSTPGVHGDEAAIHQLAEFGVILLMFGVGLHFSFRDLWRVRDIAIPGALLQMALSTAAGYTLARAYGATPAAALVLGIAISVASTVVLLRGLADAGLLDTLHGRVAVGWLVFEDLATIAILVALPLLSVSSPDASWTDAALAVGKALVFIALMLAAGPRLMPAIMSGIVRTRSRELFVLVALTAAVGTALASAALFGVSLALGAFVAGVVVGSSEFSHQVASDLLPFREAFAVLFFVSIGMLVNPAYLLGHWTEVLTWSLLVAVGKPLITTLTGALFPYPARTTFVVSAGLSQIGEFSFIVGQAALGLELITSDQYSLILAAALVSITLNPLTFRMIGPIEARVRRWPHLWRLLDRPREDDIVETATLADHVVIVGCGRVGRHIAEALGRLAIPRLVVEADPARLGKLKALAVPTLYGDASSSEILDHAGLPRARALVVTLPDDAAALAVTATARARAPGLRIIARASSWEGGRRLKAAGADEVVRPELEGGIEIVRRTLLDLELPLHDVQRYADLIRREGLDEAERPSAEQTRMLDELVAASRNVELVWGDLEPASPVAGLTVGDSRLRSRTGASIVGISRDGHVTINPGPEARLHAGDRIALIGRTEDVKRAEAVLAGAGAAGPRGSAA